MHGGGHSIQRDHDGNMWITQADGDTLTKLDVHTGAFTYYPLPKIGDCTTATYPPDQTAYYTTGQVEGHFLNANPRIGTGEISVTGEDFSCGAWGTEDGPGQLANGFLVEEDPQAGDTANVNLLDD